MIRKSLATLVGTLLAVLLIPAGAASAKSAAAAPVKPSACKTFGAQPGKTSTINAFGAVPGKPFVAPKSNKNAKLVVVTKTKKGKKVVQTSKYRSPQPAALALRC